MRLFLLSSISENNHKKYKNLRRQDTCTLKISKGLPKVEGASQNSVMVLVRLTVVVMALVIFSWNIFVFVWVAVHFWCWKDDIRDYHPSIPIELGYFTIMSQPIVFIKWSFNNLCFKIMPGRPLSSGCLDSGLFCLSVAYLGLKDRHLLGVKLSADTFVFFKNIASFGAFRKILKPSPETWKWVCTLLLKCTRKCMFWTQKGVFWSKKSEF